MRPKLDRTAAVLQLDELLADSSDDEIQPNCRGVDPELFFPRSQVAVAAQDAKEICSDCPVTAACLAYAMTFNVDGIWGGTTKPERDRLRRRHHQRPIPVTITQFTTSSPHPTTRRAS